MDRKRLLQMPFGVILIIFGLNNFLHFLPLPEKEGFASIFLETLHQARYLFPTIALIQIVAGISLLWNRWTALGLILLLPISFNIFFFHLLHDHAGLVPASIILVGNGFWLFHKRGALKPLMEGV